MIEQDIFMIVKALEIYALQQTKGKKSVDYEQIHLSLSAFGDYRLTLYADWLYIRGYEVLQELKKVFSAFVKLSPNRILSIILGKDNDSENRWSKQFFHENGIHFRQQFSDDSGENGYILQSKILAGFQFEKELTVLIREKDWQQLMPFLFQESFIYFLKGEAINDFYRDTTQQKTRWVASEYCIKVSIFDILEVRRKGLPSALDYGV